MNCECRMENYRLDHLYNHKEICELILRGNETAALEKLRKQSSLIESGSPEQVREHRRIFLTSLNRCLYYYVLFSWNVSLSGLCMVEDGPSTEYATREEFLAAGTELIGSFSRQLRECSSGMKYITLALSYIEQNLSEELSLSVVAKQIYISPCYLCKLFKNVLGQNFANYVNEQRIARAKRLLRTTNDRLDLITTKCGFRTASYFSSQFHKFCGVTPSEYRAGGLIASAS